MKKIIKKLNETINKSTRTKTWTTKLNITTKQQNSHTMRKK